MNNIKQKIMKDIGFHKEVNRVREGLCPICEAHIDPTKFRDLLSLREFEISGMCQSCQDHIFKS